MCGRFTLATPEQDIAQQFSLTDVPHLAPRYNIAPTQPVAAVRLKREGGGRELVMLHWGLIPFWADDPKIGNRMINARAETVEEKPSFRNAFRRRRCLVLADGFYEWKKQNGWKQPYYVRMEDGRPFAFAGLWEFWKDDETETAIESCTLLTTQPNGVVRPIHARMPVILQPRDYALWLDVDTTDIERLKGILTPYPAEGMDAYPVSRRVNKPAHEGPELIEPLPGEP
jgi:putative SOS response-associated peptidase YedK